MSAYPQSTLMKIRLAELKDSLYIFSWRNDPVTRSMSRNEDLIDLITHDVWYQKSLESLDRLLLIGNLSDKSVGLVRFDKIANTSNWEISIMLAPEFRAKGLSKELLSLAIAYFNSSRSGVGLIAEIKSLNLPSRKLFESLGFYYICEEGEMLRLFL